MYGNTKNNDNQQFILQSLENFSSFSGSVKDWEISGVYGVSFSQDASTNLYFLSIAKRMNNHLIYLRYSPGLKTSFRHSTGVVLISSEDSLQNLPKKTMEYDELFGAGYAFNFSGKFSANVNVRYFKQQFSVDYIKLNETNEGSYFSTIDSTEKINQWRADIGFSYQPISDLKLHIQSENLVKIEQTNTVTEDNKIYLIKDDIAGFLEADYSILDNFTINSIYHSRNSFLIGGNVNLPFSENTLSLGVSAFHYKYRQPFIAGIYPSISFSTSLFNISIGGIKYLGNSNSDNSLQRLEDKGIDNISSNYYSSDKLLASASLALSFRSEQKVKFLDLEVLGNIYPVFNEHYLQHPVAKSRVVNVSDKRLTVKPFSLCHDLNAEKIPSPSVEVNPGDTADIFFYTVVDADKDFSKTKISEMKFELFTGATEADDEFINPLLVLDKNGWDGDVGKLKYFIRTDISESAELAKKLLNLKKSVLDTTASELKNFYKIQFVYDEFVQGLQYVSDPRASSERVQTPVETLKLKGGDCDDLSVCFSSLLEGIGIQTAFVDYKSDEGINHVNLLVNTGISPEYLESITNNDKKVFVRKNTSGDEEIWLPLETTVLTNFNEAWSSGSERFYREVILGLGLMKNKIRIIDIF